MQPEPLRRASYKVYPVARWFKPSPTAFPGGFEDEGELELPEGVVSLFRWSHSWRGKHSRHVRCRFIWRGRVYMADFPLRSRRFSVTMAKRWVREITRDSRRRRR